MSLKLNLSLIIPAVDNPVQTGDASYRRNCRQLGKMFEKLGSGNIVGVAGTSSLDFRTDGVSAAATLKLVNGATSCASVIGGTTVTTTYSASGGAGQSALHDYETLVTHAADINANTTVNKWVSAALSGDVAATGTVQLTTTTTGAVTVTIGGIVVSVAGATDEDVVGALLVTAIHASRASNLVSAAYDTGTDVLTLTARTAGYAGNAITLACGGAGIGGSAVGAAALVGGTDLLTITCLVPGVIGNSISFTNASTGTTESGSGRLASGTESRVTYSL